MNTIILFIGLLTITFASGQLLNRACNGDADCGGNNWVCSAEKKCRCGVGYRQGNKQDCVYVLGKTCESGEECDKFPGAICQNNKCSCKEDSTAGQYSCVPIGRADNECTEHYECIYRTPEPDNEKECKDHKCVCKPGQHEGNDKRCKLNQGLDAECPAEDDCFQADSHNNNALECVEVDQTRKCKCKEGYVEKDGMCNGSSTTFILSASSLLLFVMAVLKM